MQFLEKLKNAPVPALQGLASQNSAIKLGSLGSSTMGGGSHSAARYSGKRGYIYYPFVESERSINDWTRSELMRKSAWAYDEIGWVAGLINNAAKMCCKITQKATTSDEEWNLLCDGAFERVTGSAERFDLAGKHDWKGMIKAAFKGRFRLGDFGIVMVSGEDGGACIQVVESYAIGDDPEAPDADDWQDGMKFDQFGKWTEVRVLNGNGGWTDYQRMDFVFFCSYDKPGMRRGLPKTYRMLNKVQDQAEIESFWSAGIKASSQVGMQVVNSRTDGDVGSGMGDAVRSRRTVQGREQKEIHVEDVNSDSKVLVMGDERLELLHDKRPAPDQVAYLDYQKRDCAAGFELPIEAVWNWSKAGGAITRTLLMQVQDFIDDEQELFISQCAVRLRNWVIAKEIKAGRLRRCNDPAWWQHSWMYGARKTADFAKDGRIYMEAVNRGELSPDRYHAMQNQDVDKEDMVTFKRWLKRKKMCDEVGLNVNYIWPPAPGTPVSPEVSELVDNLKNKEDE